MTIGIASPISSGCFLESLDDASRIEALGLSTDWAPAVTSLAKEFLNMGQRVVIFTLDPKATCQMVLRGKNLVIYVAPAASPNKFKRALSPFLGRNIRLIKKLFEVNSEKALIINELELLIQRGTKYLTADELAENLDLSKKKLF